MDTNVYYGNPDITWCLPIFIHVLPTMTFPTNVTNEWKNQHTMSLYYIPVGYT